MFDIIIKNGVIIDGTGRVMHKDDIGIKEGKIVEIGDLSNERADKVIEAKNKYVAPGFIDINNHSDTRWRIFSNPALESLIYQGITTIIGGNCGSSLAPLHNSEMIKSIRKWMDIEKINVNWVSVDDFLEEVQKIKPAVNFGTLIGHSTLRRGIIGDATRNLMEDEIRVMEEMAKKAMQDGAFGLSTGLVYSHAKLANKKEIERLARIVANFNGIYTTHVRDESDKIYDSVSEAIETAKLAGVRLSISHLKIMGAKNWPMMDRVLKKIQEAK
ncbi:MAG: amidohydrolase family protein, partial [Candidatus Moranbacteria bacterium]|nr:amidohydrolase family protein [Candidatus Moranbacteria bacterium]